MDTSEDVKTEASCGEVAAQVLSEGRLEGDASVSLSLRSALSVEGAPPLAHEALANLRLLFVEDEEEDGQIIIGHFKELGIKKIVWVRSAVHALFQLREDKALFPHILITELVLAGTNGIQLTAKLRAERDPSIRKLPVITITSRDSPSIYRRATKYGICAYLKMPVSPHALRTALLRAIEGKIIEPPLEFGRSWIDVAEDAEDSGSEELGQSQERDSFLAWLFAKITGVVRPWQRSDRQRHIDLST